jgi:N,N'-diacetyllegionaminate synthase
LSFFSTGFDIESLEFLKTLKMGLWKIPSGEITNLPYLEFIAKCREPVILSTGMSTLQEIKDAISILISNGVQLKQLTVLHCNTDYPTPFSDVHLNVLKTLAQELKVNIG